MNDSKLPHPPKKVMVLYNPFAGNGKAKIIARKACEIIQEKQWQLLECCGSSYAGEIENKFASTASQSADLIILIGGDGTLRELVSGLLKEERRPEIAFIPMGNANVVARELSIPLKPLDALALLDHSSPREVDVGQIIMIDHSDAEHAQIFLAMLEVGVGAKIVHMVNTLRAGKLQRLYQLWGDLVYALAGLLAFVGKPLSQVSGVMSNQTINSEKAFKTSHLIVANMKTYAKGWSFTPDANCQDGLLNLAQAKRNSRLAELGRFLAAANRRKQSSSLMHYDTATHIRLSAEDKLYMQIDGDPVNFEGQAEISIRPGAFRIHAP